MYFKSFLWVIFIIHLCESLNIGIFFNTRMNCTRLTPHSSRFSKSSNTLFQEITVRMLNSCLSKILIGFSNYILSTTMLADNYTDKSFLQSFLWSRNSGHVKSEWSCVNVDVPNDWKRAVKYQSGRSKTQTSFKVDDLKGEKGHSFHVSFPIWPKI